MLPLIAFRLLQGVGAGAVQPIAYVIVADIYTPAERARVQGLLSGMFGIAAVIGPTLGGVIVQHLSWSYIFWINVPIGAAAIAMLAIFFHESTRQRSHEIDFIGAFLLMIGGGSIMTALVQIGHLDGKILGLLATIGLVALAVLVLHERRVAEPILPFRLWSNREVALCNFASLPMGTIVISVGGFLPTCVQGVMGYSPSVAGIAFGATSITWAVASFIAASVMIRTTFRFAAVVGGAAITFGNIILIFMTPSSGALWAAAGASVIGFGLGFCNTTYLVAVQSAATKSERGAVTSANLFMRIVGQSIGAALFGAVVNIGMAYYDPRLASVAERLMDPNVRNSFHGEDLEHLTSTLALALRNIYFIGVLVGLAMILLGRRFSAHPPTNDG